MHFPWPLLGLWERKLTLFRTLLCGRYWAKFISPVLKRRRLRLRMFKWCTQGQTAKKTKGKVYTKAESPLIFLPNHSLLYRLGKVKKQTKLISSNLSPDVFCGGTIFSQAKPIV